VTQINQCNIKEAFDFNKTMRHKNGVCWFKTGKDQMDTSKFDKQANSHLNFYHNFMNGSKILIGLVIVTLVIMAATLL
jgi:hypothetical protein